MALLPQQKLRLLAKELYPPAVWRGLQKELPVADLCFNIGYVSLDRRKSSVEFSK